MAVTAPSVGYHYLDRSVAEDVSRFIYTISPDSKPLFMMSGTTNSTGVLHEWQRRELTTYQHNAAFEGFVYSHDDPQRLPTRLHNTNQIFQKQIRVSETTVAITHHAINNPYTDQVETKLIEIGTDFENAIMNGTIGTGTTNVARKMQGITTMIATMATTYTSFGGTVTLSEDKFNDQIQNLWDIGAAGRDVLVGGSLKRVISGYNASNTHFMKADERRVVNSIGVYDSDFFTAMIHLSRTVPATGHASSLTNQTGLGMLLVDRTMLKVAYLRRPHTKTLPEVADSQDGVIKAEFTYETGHPNAHLMAGNIANFTN